MVKYEKISISDFKKLGRTSNRKGYEIKGIPRGVGLNHIDNFYELYFFLQDRKDFLKILIIPQDGMDKENESLVKAASEANLKAIVRGHVDMSSNENNPNRLDCRFDESIGDALFEAGGYKIFKEKKL